MADTLHVHMHGDIPIYYTDSEVIAYRNKVIAHGFGNLVDWNVIGYYRNYFIIDREYDVDNNTPEFIPIVNFLIGQKIEDLPSN